MSAHHPPEADFRPRSLTDAVIEVASLFLLVFTPLAFGTVQPWSEAITELVILAMVVAWIIGSVSRREFRVELPPGWLPAAFFLALILVQAVPLPKGLVELLSPRIASVSRELSTYTGSVWSFIPLSLAPHETWREGLKILSIAVFFVVLYNTCRSGAQAKRAIWTMILMGAGLAIFGIAQRASWTGRLYWVGPAVPTEPFGPFVNRAHFAGLMIVVIPMALALVLAERTVGKSRQMASGWRARVKRWSSEETGPTTLVAFLILLMGGAALVSRSRGGMVSLIGALLCMAAFASYGRSGLRRASSVVAIVVALIMLAGLWIGGDIFYGTVERLAQEIGRPAESIRARLWADALRLWRESPVLGTGLGTFDIAFPQVRSLQAPVAFTHAESDWVQLLTDTGLVGLGLALATSGWLGLALLRRFREGGGPWVRPVALAGLVALLGTAVQGIGNFNLPIMSNQLYLGVALVLALRSQNPGSSTERQPDQPTIR